MSIQTRLQRLEKIKALNEQEVEVNIYIVGDKEVTIFDEPESKIITIEEYKKMQASWKKDDIIIHVTEYDYDY